MSEVDVATGTTIVFGTSGFTAQLKSVNIGPFEREALETSHMGTAAPGAGKVSNKTFMPGDLSDAGSIDMEFHFNPDTEPPIDQPPEQVTITWPLVAPNVTPPIWVGEAFATSYVGAGELEQVMIGNMTLKITGEVTITPAST